MKRDLDLMRKVLGYLEEMPNEKRVKELEIDGFSEEKDLLSKIIRNIGRLTLIWSSKNGHPVKLLLPM